MLVAVAAVAILVLLLHLLGALEVLEVEAMGLRRLLVAMEPRILVAAVVAAVI